METELKNAVGKSAGEVLRDLGEFLSLSVTVKRGNEQLELSSLTPLLNMRRQLAFSLMSEAATQGWEPLRAEGFIRQAFTGRMDTAELQELFSAFAEPEGEAFAALSRLYGNRFTVPDDGYWATLLAVAIDTDSIPVVLKYLHGFFLVLTEFAYMGDANPDSTYAWGYCESFQHILDELLRQPDPPPLPLKVRAIGGTSGKRDANGYLLSLGVDIENPNRDRMARDVEIDVTLKDKNGEVIATLRDRIGSIDPAAVYHFGITRLVRGAAVASLSATAKAASHLKLSTPIMNHVRLEKLRVKTTDGATELAATLVGKYDTAISSLGLGLQLLSADNKILGGITEWCFEGLDANGSREITATIPVEIKNAKKLVYSVDFDALELI